MPAILKWHGYRFFFFSDEGKEPPHIHVAKDGRMAKFWLEDCKLAYNDYFKDNEVRRLRKVVLENQERFLEAWNEYEKENIKNITFNRDSIVLHFSDGRKVFAPLVFYPRLLHGTAKQRGNWEIIGAGRGIHWPDLDEDLSIDGLLHGRPSVEYRKPKRSGTKKHPPELRA